MPGRERVLVLLLRLGAALTLCAFPMALLPVEWMAAVHRKLGLGEMPVAPVFDYLARSVSLLYGFHGGLLLVVSTDVHRFLPIVRYLGAMNLTFGAMLLAIDLAAGLPLFWVLAEGPPVALTGAGLLYLARPTRVVGNGRSG